VLGAARSSQVRAALRARRSVHLTARTAQRQSRQEGKAVHSSSFAHYKVRIPNILGIVPFPAGWLAPARNDLSQTELLADGILSLPIYESLPDETVSAVAETLERIVHSQRERRASTIEGEPRRVAAGR